MNSRGHIVVLGQRVRAIRKMRGLNRQQVADAARIAMTTVRYLECGRQGDTTLHTLVGLSQALGVPVGVLIGERPVPSVDPHLLARARSEAARIMEVA